MKQVCNSIMKRRHFYYLTILLMAFALFLMVATSCNTFEIGIERTPTFNIQLTEFTGSLATQNTILATRIAIPTATATGSTTYPLIPTQPSPTLPPPAFSNLRFAPEPDETLVRQFYVEGTPRIFALWDYSGMQEGMSVRRVWKRNNEDWVVREEPWAYNRYGSEGTVRDIYVFEDEIGLEAGEYTLTLYINGVAQNPYPGSASTDLITFWIFEPDITAPLASPDKSHTAIVRFGGNLFIEDPNGEIREIAQVQEIAAMAWFPDGRNLLFVERNRSNQLEPSRDTGVTHRMFIIDTETKDQKIIGTAGEDFHSPIISPNGVFISVLIGSQLQEGCIGSPGLAFIELDSELHRQAVHLLSSFSGLSFPNDNASTIILASVDNPRAWESETRLLVNLDWLCPPPDTNPDGLYVLDLSNKSAERKN
jgi:hypothetical protein